MIITPIEIRQKTFEKAFRGYEKEEVDAFLRSLSHEWEKLIDETKELKRRLDIAEREVQRLRDVENSLFQTLKTAEVTGANVIEQANKAAELHLREAQINAEAILNDAKNRAKNIMEEAEERAREIVGDLQDEVKAVVKEYNYIDDQKENLLESLKSFVQETMERVERAQAKSNKKEVEKKLKEVKSLLYEKKSIEPHLAKSAEVKPIENTKAESEKPTAPIELEVTPVTKPETINNTTLNPESANIQTSVPTKPETIQPDIKTENKSFFDTI